MRLSRYLAPTLKEDPKEAEIISHKYLIRGGFIRKVAAGIYDFLPLGLRVIRKIENIVREEMDRAGALEILMPMVIPAELWKESGRWDVYGKELLRFKDRHDREFCLGPTHEEVVTDIVRREVRSYKQLPLNLYQIQTKFRDEPRPRFGLMRGREFIMKDAYSFDADWEGLDKSYNAMYEAYSRIFKRCGLEFRVVEADTGNIGGTDSHEFMVLAETGEDEIVSCPSCGYAANVERADFMTDYEISDEEEKPLEKVHTPDRRTIEEVSEYLNVSPEKMIKTLVYSTDKGEVVVLVRGDFDVNEVKVKNAVGANWIQLAEPEVIEKITGAPVGFAGPVNLDFDNILIDRSVLSVKNGVTGANEKDYHFVNVNPGRDFSVPEERVMNLRLPVKGDRCPRCGAELEFSRGIEVGHIFKLGTKYSEAMKATFLDRDGKEKPFIMGCYGIGVTRVAAAAIEQNHDENGIIWPITIAPFEVIIIPTNWDKEEVRETAEKIYEELIEAGIEVIIDDREERAGFKFKDADLIGYPFKIVVGERGLKKGVVEIKSRRGDISEEVEIKRVAKRMIELVENEKEKYQP